MSIDLIEKYCVKVLELDSSGEQINQGSGVVILFMGKQYVLTSHHCFKSKDLEKILIKNQATYSSEFELIRVVSIMEFNEEDDWILLELENNSCFDHSFETKLTKHVIPGVSVKFIGYQSLVTEEFRLWESKVLNVDKKRFKIKLTEGDTFQQAGEDGKYYAKGLSGSGVYIFQSGVPLLIGIVSSVQSEQAYNNDIQCCHISCVKNVINNFSDLESLDSLKGWEESIDDNSVVFTTEEWKLLNIDEFKNISRKNKVLIENVKEAEEATSRHIQRYLSIKQTIEEYENDHPITFIKFRKLVERFKHKVKDDYSRIVSDSNTAKDKKMELTKELRDDLSNILPENVYASLDLADYQVIEWLMICSLNFTKND